MTRTQLSQGGAGLLGAEPGVRAGDLAQQLTGLLRADTTASEQWQKEVLQQAATHTVVAQSLLKSFP